MSYPSPRTPGSTPIHEYDSVYTRMSSATPTPSPRPTWAETTPRRPATRAAHGRFNSYSQTGNDSFSPRPPKDSPRYNSNGQYSTANGAQTAVFYDDFYSQEQQPVHQSPHPPHARPPTSFSHTRRSSTAVPPARPQTVRPVSTQRAKPPPPPPKATEADARKYRIPAGYSLKNWDPTEEPVLLLGSVFDANSLGKWIYDWTVSCEGPSTPISDMAGELWLLLIQLAGKVKRADEIVGRVRSKDNRDLVEEFIDAGERITEKLRSLLKSCEAPMLKAAKRKQSGLGRNAGVEFVQTLFGRDRELAKTEKFMQQVRLFNLRFDANCEEILRNPTQ